MTTNGDSNAKTANGDLLTVAERINVEFLRPHPANNYLVGVIDRLAPKPAPKPRVSELPARWTAIGVRDGATREMLVAYDVTAFELEQALDRWRDRMRSGETRDRLAAVLTGASPHCKLTKGEAWTLADAVVKELLSQEMEP